MGDFNAYNDFVDPLHYLTGLEVKQSSLCRRQGMEKRGSLFVDSWLAVHPNNTGHTFSNMVIIVIIMYANL